MLYMMAQAVMAMMSSWLFTKRYFDKQQFSELILVWFILFFSQIVLIELFWGAIGRLYFGNIFLTQVAIFILAILSCRKEWARYFTKPEIKFLLDNKLLLFAFSVFLSFFLSKVYVNLINPPMSPGSLQAYLSFPATWMANGNLDNPFHIFGSSPFLNPNGIETGSGVYYPINPHLFYTWLMMPLRNAFLADAGEAPFYLIGIVAIYAILRKYDLDRVTALLSGFLWALIPNLFKQIRFGSEIDVICAVLFLLVFYTLLSLKSDFGLKNSILFGISTGLLIGTKVINHVWLAAFLPFICYILYNGAKANKLTLSKKTGFFGVIVLMAVLFGGYMFIKNYFFTGNPLFPYNVKLFGKTIFKGLIDNSAYKTLVAPNDNLDFRRILFKEGLGVQFLALILPATFIPLFFYKYLRAKLRPIGEYMLLFATPLIMLILYSRTINIFTMRYLFPYLSLGLIVAVIFVTKLPAGRIYLKFIALISIATGVFKLANGYELAAALLLSIALFLTLLVYRKKAADFYKTKAFNKAVLAALLAAAALFVFLNNKYDKEEFDRYPLNFNKKELWQRDLGKGWKALNEITGGGARVAHTGRQEFYPLFGTRLKNYATYISVNEKAITPYNKPDGLYRKSKDFGAWRENLKKERIQYLFIALPCPANRESEDPAKFPIEDEWALTHPGDFKLLFANSLSRIYQVLIK